MTDKELHDLVSLARSRSRRSVRCLNAAIECPEHADEYLSQARDLRRRAWINIADARQKRDVLNEIRAREEARAA